MTYRHLNRLERRSWLASDEGQRALSLVHCWVRSALSMAGAVRVGAAATAFRSYPFVIEPEHVIVCFERLTELGALHEVGNPEGHQDAERVFVAPRRESFVERYASTRHLRLVLVLTALQQASEPLTLGELCDRIHGEREEVAGLVQELVERGQVSREPAGERFLVVARDGSSDPEPSGLPGGRPE